VKNIKISFLGAGNMAEAIINGLLKSRVSKPGNICASDISKTRLQYIAKRYGIKAVSDNTAAVKSSTIIFLAVKPQQVTEVLKDIAGSITKNHLVVSIAAGITTSLIEKHLGNKLRVIRSMPNTPALLGAGAVAVCAGKYSSKTDVALAKELFSSVGIVAVLKESQMNAVTAVSGSGPAYVFYLAEALEAAGTALGLPAEVSRQFSRATISGAGRMLAEIDESAQDMRRKVTSPGGTTAAAVKYFEQKGFRRIIRQAVGCAVKRAKELSV
jgi:pyrroline-5-carboxylate reductase